MYNFSKCTIIVRLLEFVTMVLVKGDLEMLKVKLGLIRQLCFCLCLLSSRSYPHLLAAPGPGAFLLCVFRVDCAGGV